MRKARAKKRVLLPDPIYNDTLVTRFLNNLMYDGKKNTASAIFHDAIAIVAKRTNEDGLEVWNNELNNCDITKGEHISLLLKPIKKYITPAIKPKKIIPKVNFLLGNRLNIKKPLNKLPIANAASVKP